MAKNMRSFRKEMTVMSAKKTGTSKKKVRRELKRRLTKALGKASPVFLEESK